MQGGPLQVREDGVIMMKRYQCSICGHIYDPDEGDPGQNIPPGTAFEELPESWVCPICGAEKFQFRELT
jgi:rubredoxin